MYFRTNRVGTLDAAERGQRPALGRRRRRGLRRRGVLVTVRRSKTNQEGETTDVRFVKGGVARALRTLRAAASPAPEDRVVPLSPKMVGLRFQAAARAAGVERVTARRRQSPDPAVRLVGPKTP